MPNNKTYSLRGKVVKVYEPREVVQTYGGKKRVSEVTDLYLTLDSGAKVKVSFWNTDVSHHEGNRVVITGLVFKGKYQNTPQYSSTKESKITVATKGAAAPVAAEPEDETPEGAVLEDEPQFQEPEGAEPEQGTDEPIEGAEPEVEPTPAPKKRAVKKTAAKPAEDAPAVAVIHPDAIAEITALAGEAIKIAKYTADPIMLKDPEAFQGWASTIYINLSTKNYYANGGARQ